MLVKSEYVVYADLDEIWDNDKLEKLMSGVTKYDYYIDNDDTLIHEFGDKYRYWCEDDDNKSFVYRWNGLGGVYGDQEPIDVTELNGMIEDPLTYCYREFYHDRYCELMGVDREELDLSPEEMGLRIHILEYHADKNKLSITGHQEPKLPYKMSKLYNSSNYHDIYHKMMGVDPNTRGFQGNPVGGNDLISYMKFVNKCHGDPKLLCHERNNIKHYRRVDREEILRRIEDNFKVDPHDDQMVYPKTEDCAETEQGLIDLDLEHGS